MNKRPLILIVDDQADNRFAIKLALKNEDYDFIEAEDGSQSLSLAQEHQPTIILMDAIMPVMDGFQATQQLRLISELERTPILMITALNEKDDRIKALDAGVSDFISKPFDKHELIARCRSYINMYQLNAKYVHATHNPITGLPNRGALQSDLKKYSQPMVIVSSFAGYDNLAELYSVEILQQIEELFIAMFKENFPLECDSYTFYHPHAGLFAIALDLALNPDLTRLKISTLLESFYDLMRQKTVRYDDYELIPLLTFGISIDGEFPYENAKTAFTQAVKQRCNYLFSNDVTEQAHRDIKNNLHWIKKIKLGINEDRFQPFFQAIYNNTTKEVEKYECLIRLVDTNGDVISPFHFLEISKKAKYYHQLTKIMIEKSFNVFKDRKEEFSLNLAASDIESEEIRSFIFEKLDEHKDIAQRLVFELLEDENFDSFDILKSFIIQVKSYGVQIAVDDFGSGYSNFTRLMEFQPNILKLDGSLIKNIDTDNFSVDIVTTIHSFALKSGLKTIAEFVASKEIHEHIQKIGIDYSQGYYFSPPISIEELNKLS